MTHGRHDRRDARRPDRAGRRRRRPLRAPPHGVRGELPRDLQPRSTASSAATTAASPPSRRTTARACRSRPTASARTTADSIRVGVRPEKITLRAPGNGDASGGDENSLRGTVVVAAFLGTSIQYVVRAPGGEELTVFAAEPSTDRSRDSFGPGRDVRLTWDPHHTFVVAQGADPMSDPDPRIERALEEFFEAERLLAAGLHRPRRQLRPRALRARRRVLAACGGVQGEAEKASKSKTEAAAVSHPKTTIGNWTFSNWPLYIDKKVLKNFDKQYGGHVKYVEEINDNFEFFGEGPPAAAGQAADRARHRDADRLHGRALGAPRLRRADRQEERPERRRTSSTTSRRSTTTPSASTRCRGSPARSASATTPRRPAASSRASRTSSTRSSRARSRCSPSPTTRPTPCCSATASTPSKASIDQILGAIEKIDKANKAGQIRRFTGNDYTQPTSRRATSGSRSPTRATSSSSRPTTRTCASPIPEEGAMLFTDNMMMPAEGRSTRTRPRR